MTFEVNIFFNIKNRLVLQKYYHSFCWDVILRIEKKIMPYICTKLKSTFLKLYTIFTENK